MNGPAVAQTDAQLLGQLRDAGWDESDLGRVAVAYQLAARLFRGRVRVTGKPFLAHVVGTASVAQTAGERPDVVLAALLHAAYARGDFGDGSTGITEDKRTRVRSEVGPEVEQLVAWYTEFPWIHEAIAELRDRDRLDDRQRDVVALRLANDVDELLGREHWLHASPDEWMARFRLAATMAEHHGLVDLGRQLELAIEADDVVRPRRRFARGLRRLRRLPTKVFAKRA